MHVLRRCVVSGQWSLKAVDCFIQVVSNVGTYRYCGLFGLVIKYRNHNLEVSGFSLTGFTGLFLRVSLSKTLQDRCLPLVKPRKDMNNSTCRHYITETELKAAKNIIKPFDTQIRVGVLLEEIG